MRLIILEYVAEWFIEIGNKLSEFANPGHNASMYGDIVAPPKRNWMLSYFGEWPIRWENDGVVLNIDPFFIVMLSSMTAVIVTGLEWVIYVYYFQRVWVSQENTTVSNPQQVDNPLDWRDDNHYNAPPGMDELSPNGSYGPAAVEIAEEIRRMYDAPRLTRRPAAVNIQPNYDYVRPNPRIPYEETVAEQQILQEEISGQLNCYDLDVHSIENSEDEDDQQRYASEDMKTDGEIEEEEDEEILGIDCEPEKIYEIVEEDSDDSSSQTEYDRYNERGDEIPPPANNTAHGDHNINNNSFKDHIEKEFILRKLETQVGTGSSVTDRVVLHQFQRGRSGSVPCLAPFAMKLETYLRMAEIEYDVIFDCDSSGPWLSYHNEDFKGASSCMQFLRQVFPSQTENFVPSSDMKIVSWFITVLVEYHLYWELIIWRWILNNGRDVLHNQPKWNLIFSDPKEISDCVKMGAQYHGFGHLSDSITDVKTAVMNDLEALSESLGDKDFLTGTAPKEVDCSAFAILSQLIWSSPDPIIKTTKKSFPINVMRYCHRMKSILWSDWDDILSKHEQFSTNVATYNSSAETSPLVSPRSVASSLGSFGNVKRKGKPFIFRLPPAMCTETTEVIVRKIYTENQYWNVNNLNLNISNIPNSLNLCTEEYFDENLEDMESIKMNNLDLDPDIVDPDESDSEK